MKLLTACARAGVCALPAPIFRVVIAAGPSSSVAQDAAGSHSLEQRVQAELVRTAYRDALYGAPFAMVVVLLFAYATFDAFGARVVLPWLGFALLCNVLRLIFRAAYLRRPVRIEDTGRWSALFVIVSAATGLSWGMGAWLFYTPHESIYRVIVVLSLAGLTTGASRLLAPILLANLLYVFTAIGPLMVRVLADTALADPKSYVLTAMCVLYLLYMTVAARQQVRTLERSIRLGHENVALVESLGAAKERAEKLNRNLSQEIAHRQVVEGELRAASERALAASRAKTEFLAVMSHEIRTPMNGIIGMLRIVRDSPLSPAQRDHVETAAASADTLLDLLSHILDFSKIEAGHLELERIAFSPAAIAGSVVDIMRPRATAKALKFDLDLDRNLPAGAVGDPTRLRQILFNLVGNALKFTERGSVTLRVSGAGSDETTATLTFTVTDTGVGMGEQALGEIFRPFRQADSSMSRRFGGTGLGLAISQKLVEAMGGSLGASSKLGEGSVFQFTLRLPRPGAVDPLRPPHATEFALPRLHGRVLVVEDDRINQRVIGHFLKQMGLDTGLAEDGSTAIEVALREPWDLVLMDCQLPGVDGLEATRQIRTRQPDRSLPIIALTANASTQDRTACLAAGMNDFLTKPVRLELLAATLQRWLPSATPPLGK